MQSYFNQMSGAMSNVSPEDMQRMKDMLAELNQMLEQRAARRGSPTFERFMERYGDFFPENPQTLDELLEVMAQRMAAMQAHAQLDDARAARAAAGARRAAARGHGPALAGRPARRATCSSCSRRWAGTAATTSRVRTRSASPRPRRSCRSSATSTSSRTCCGGATSPGALAEVDIDRARELLGDDAADSLDRMSRAGQDARGGRPHREPGRPLRADAPGHPPDRPERPLRPLPEARATTSMGRHELERTRRSATSGPTTRSPTSSATRSTSTSSAPSATRSTRTGGGTPVRLSPDDFEIERTEHLTGRARC